METSAVRTTAIRLENRGFSNFRLSRVTLGGGAKFRNQEPRAGSNLPAQSIMMWEIEWSGDKTESQRKPTVLEFTGDGSITVSLSEGENPAVSTAKVQAEVGPSRERGGFEITFR